MKKRKPVFTIFQKLYGLLERRQKVIFLIIVLIMILSAGLSQMTPTAIGWLTDDILSHERISFLKVIPFLVFILIVNVVNELIKILRRVMVEDTATKTEKKARGMVLVSLLRAPLSYFKENMTGNIHGRLNRCLEGTVRLEKLVFMDFAPAIFNSIAAVITIFCTLPVVLVLPMLLVIPIGTAIVFRQISTQRGIRVELLETKSAMDGTIVELLNGIEVIRIADSVNLEAGRFDKKSEYLRKKEMRHHVQMAKYDCFKFINEAVFTVLMIGVSTFLATRGVISVGSVLTAYLCFNQLLTPLKELHRILDELSESLVLAEDFFRMMELPCDFSYALPEKKAAADSLQESGMGNTSENSSYRVDSPGNMTWGVSATVPDSFLTHKNSVSVRDLVFSYNQEETVLDHISLDIPQGAFVGIAGPSGCGKSTFIKALCKMEQYEGEICIDGKNLADLSRKEIAGIIALVPQSPFLIAGTIYDNICYGLEGEIARSEVEQAAKKAYIYEFIQSLPEQFDTYVAEGGGNLSGGQRQRIAIARIFLRKPKILILDEATSALDNTSEKHIQMEIERLKEEDHMTVISIAHRLTTLKNCDRILVFDKGDIAESGKYDALIEQNGIFSDMYYGRLK